MLSPYRHLRSSLGSGVELIHDAHERLRPPAAVRLAKELEAFDLFFLEDLFAPEDDEYLRLVRAHTLIPLAVGELYTGPQQFVPVVRERLVDFIRCHIAAIGGLTPARKLAYLCEYFGVRTAWHGPDDVSPVGHAAQLHLEMASSNFGVHEAHLFGEQAREVFPGTPEVRDGAVWCNDRPGLGVDIDEAQARRYPFGDEQLNGGWATVRRADGGVARP